MTDTEKPSIIGRDRVLLDQVAQHFHREAKTRYDYTPVTETRRGAAFEIKATPTTHPRTHADAARTYRVTIELLEVKEP